MSTSAERIERAAQQLRPVVADEFRALGDDELCGIAVRIEGLGRLVDSLRVTVAAEVGERSRVELGSESLVQRHGHVKGVHLLEYLTRISGAEAARRIRLGTALRTGTTLTGESLPGAFPAVADALVAGEIGVDAALGIVRCLDDARRTANDDDLATAESVLVEKATREPADCVSDLARVLRDRLDPDGVRPREDEIRIRRGIRLGRERNGVTPISGGLEPATAALLKSAFSEANAPGAQPRFLSEQDRRDGTETTIAADGSEIVPMRDVRSRQQRQHDVFAGLLKAGVRNVGTHDGQLRSTADVTAVILLSDLTKSTGPGWLEGIEESVSASTVERLACDGRYRRIILGATGEVLHLGKTRYPFSVAQRRALAVRDGGCVWDGCTAPPGWCDAHHVREYNSNGGEGATDIDNGVLLCEAHHILPHHSEWQLRIVNGKPQVLAPFAIDPSQTWRPVGKSRITLGRTG
jgi:hypothetical protein